MLYDNIDELHSQWLEEFQRISWSHCEDAYGERSCLGLICFIDESSNAPKGFSIPDIGMAYEEDLYMNVLGTVMLPCGSDKLIKDMAKFSQMSFSAFHPLPSLSAAQNVQFVQNLFCLQSVLLSSFPKNLKTGRFKSNTGPDSVLSLDALDAGKRQYCAFSGLGVILLNATRIILEPLATDEKIVDISDQLVLSIVEGKMKNE